jgi:hypothetical protein
MQGIALHPFDQFRAFVALRDKGQGEEAIAEAFFVATQIVKQRLKLASVAPALREDYAEDGMTLEQLMAFTEIARAGAFVTLDRDGSLAVYRGYVRPKDEPREESAVQNVDGAENVEQGADAGISGWQSSAAAGAAPSSPQAASRSAMTCPSKRMTAHRSRYPSG